MSSKWISFRSDKFVGEQALEITLKDCLIKSFMVIFTHESSYHLLLNPDLIQIAFYCLEYCSEISKEA